MPPSRQSSPLFLLHSRSVEPVRADSLFLQPQELSVQLRPGVSQSFLVTITRPSDQPIRELTMDTTGVPSGVSITFSYLFRSLDAVEVSVNHTDIRGKIFKD